MVEEERMVFDIRKKKGFAGMGILVWGEADGLFHSCRFACLREKSVASFRCRDSPINGGLGRLHGGFCEPDLPKPMRLFSER